MTHPDDGPTREEDRTPGQKPATPGEDRTDHEPEREPPPETARRPAPGIEHEPEPSGENLIPKKDGPGTF